MRDADKKSFRDILGAAMDLHGRTLTPAALGLWWVTLERYSLEVVQQAVVACLRDPEVGRFPITPAAVIAQIPDPWGSADEAWALALESMDESKTVCIFPEILEALSAAQPILDGGDQIGARIAFRGAYERIVQSRKMSGQAPEWELSLGFDVAQRGEAVVRAVQCGRISAAKASQMFPGMIEAEPAGSVRLLPPPEDGEFALVLSAAVLHRSQRAPQSPGSWDGPPDGALEKLREVIAAAQTAEEQRQAAAAAAIEAQRESFVANKRAAIEKLRIAAKGYGRATTTTTDNE